MKLCNHRSSRNRVGECWLSVDTLTNRDSFQRWKAVDALNIEYHRDTWVFRANGDEGVPFTCTEAMAEVCPYRRHTPMPRRPPKPILTKKCEYCDGVHYSETAFRVCQVKLHIKRSVAPFDPKGTKEPLYEPWMLDFPTFQNPRAFFWKVVVRWVFERDGARCVDCGTSYRNSSDGLDVHHIIPRSLGGSDHPRNLKLVCRACHNEYTRELPAERRREAVGRQYRTLDQFSDRFIGNEDVLSNNQ